MLRRLIHLRPALLSFLLCLGMLGAFVDPTTPNEPVRLHGRSRPDRAVRVGDDLHVAPHADVIHHDHHSVPDDAQLTVATVLPPPANHAEELPLHSLAGFFVSTRPLPPGRAPPSLF